MNITGSDTSMQFLYISTVLAVTFILLIIGYFVYKALRNKRKDETLKPISAKPVLVSDNDIHRFSEVSETFLHDYTGYLLSLKLPGADIPEEDKTKLAAQYHSNGLMPKFDWDLLSDVLDLRRIIIESSIREGFAIELSNAYSMMVEYEACIKNRAESVAKAAISKFKLT